jgi:hypothetical protein
VTLPVGCPGQYVLAATLAGGGSVTLSVVETGGFPNTTANPSGALPWWLVAVAAAIFLAVVLEGIRRRRTKRS